MNNCEYRDKANILWGIKVSLHLRCSVIIGIIILSHQRRVIQSEILFTTISYATKLEIRVPVPDPYRYLYPYQHPYGLVKAAVNWFFRTSMAIKENQRHSERNRIAMFPAKGNKTSTRRKEGRIDVGIFSSQYGPRTTDSPTDSPHTRRTGDRNQH